VLLSVGDNIGSLSISVKPFYWPSAVLSTCWEPSEQRVRVSHASKAMKNAKQSRCVIGIKGQALDPDNPVDIWFDSLKSVANVLSKENQQLLKVIAEQQPQSVTELATLTGRAVSNVSRTLKTLGKYNLVEMQKSRNGLAVKLRYQSMLLLIQPLE
jgi:predicted transcriptional regulator